MKKYKYKVGQRIEYTARKYIEKICKCCGHERTDSKTIKVKGKIVKRYYDLVYRIQSMPITDKVEKRPDGTSVHKPEVSDLQLNKSEPVYEVKRDKAEKGIADDIVTEDEITN